MHLLTVIFPFIGMFEKYSLKTFLFDFKAGLTIGVVLVPQAIAYSSLAGVPAIYALVSAIFPLYIYAALGSSRQLSVGPEALSSVLVGVSVLEVLAEEAFAEVAPHEIATAIGLVCGIITLGLGVFQLGFIDNLLNGFLLVGFVTGVGCLVMIEQLPGLLALPRRPSGSLSSYAKLVESVQQLQDAKWQATVLGICTVIFLLAMPEIRSRFKRNVVLQNLPDIFVLVVVAILLSWAIGFENRGIPVIGTLQSTLPSPGVPYLTGDLFSKIMQPSIIIVIVGFIESIASARAFALKNDYEVTETQELIALGAANIFGSFFSCYPVFGSLPRSRILATSGGKTTLATVIGATIVLIIVLALGKVFYYLPRTVVAGIVFVAAYRLIEWGEIWFTLKMRRWAEIFFMVVTFIVTFFLAIETGVILSLILSTLILVNRNCKPHLVILGRITGASMTPTPLTEGSTLTDLHEKQTNDIAEATTEFSDGKPDPAAMAMAQPSGVSVVQIPSVTDAFADIAKNPDAHLISGVLIIAIESPLQYYNCGELKHQIAVLIKTYEKSLRRCTAVDCIRPETEGPGVGGLRAILFDVKHCDDIDTSGMHMLRKIVKTFSHHNIQIGFTRVLPSQVDMLSHSGLVDIIGKELVFPTIHEGVSYLAK